MQALRVVHVVPYFEHAWAYGGIPRAAAAMTRGLALRGHHVTVWTTDACDAISRAPAPMTSSDGIDVRVFPNRSNRLAYHLQLFLPRGLSAHARRHAGDFDVAHLHGCHHLPGAIAARELRRAGVPYVITPNGTAPRLERRRLAKLVFDATVGRDILPGAARVTAVTDTERRQLRGLGVPDDAIRVVPNPLDLSEFDRPIEGTGFRDRYRVPAGPLVLFLGKLTPRKHVEVLVDAFASLRIPDATLVIAGNDLGAGGAIRARVRRRDIEARTRWTGLLAGRARLEALAEADVVVYPSREEIFGIVALEAILCGTPVIVGDDSGCGEIIRSIGGGVTVPPGAAPPLAAAITGVLADRARWRLRAHDAQPLVRARCSAAHVAELIEDVYRDVMRPGAAAIAASARA